MRRGRRTSAVLVAAALVCFVSSAASAQQSTPAATAPDSAIAGRDHYAERDGLRLYLWEKYRPALLDSAVRSGRVILLLHGATWTGRPDFDLRIRDYSLMDVLATAGYDVWALDVHGYGRSDTTSADWSDARSAALDVAAAVEYIRNVRAVGRVSLLGWSWGTQVAGLFAAAHPERVNRLVLYAPFWRGTPGRKLEAPTEKYRLNTEAAAREDFVPGQAEPDVVELYVREALREAPRSPNGVRVDRTTLPLLRPQQLTVPTLVIHAEHDPISRMEDVLPFFAQLHTADKRYVLLPDGGHAIMLEKGRHRFHRAVLDFLGG